MKKYSKTKQSKTKQSKIKYSNYIRKLVKTVDKPTYDIVDKLLKVDDQRASTYWRSLNQYSNTFKQWSVKYPDLLPLYHDLRKKRLEIARTNIISQALTIATKYPWKDWYKTNEDCEDLNLLKGGPVSGEKLISNPEMIAKLIKGFATFIGAEMVGITQLNEAWIFNEPLSLFAPYSKYLNHNYIIVVACQTNYKKISCRNGFVREAELGCLYSKGLMIVVQLAAFIRGLGYNAEAHSNDSILHVAAAVDAGLGESGRWGNLVTPEYGSNIRIWSVTTDMPMIIDKPIDFGLQKFCEQCKICANLCPSGAIPLGEKTVRRGVKKWFIDYEKCVRYQESIRGQCQLCHIICPWSKPDTLFYNTVWRILLLNKYLNPTVLRLEKKFYKDLNKLLSSNPHWLDIK